MTLITLDVPKFNYIRLEIRTIFSKQMSNLFIKLFTGSN